MALFKRKTKKNDYFELLRELAEYSVKAAEFLISELNDYSPEAVQGALQEMHEIEHTADLMLHDLNRKLAREFITPIERQDISSIANEIDEVTDSIEDILLRCDMFNIKKLRSETFEFADIILAATKVMCVMMEDFCDFRKSLKVRESIIEINRLEEEADALYTRCMRRLYTEEEDPIQIIAWTELFRRMEGCCDDLEDVSELVENVIMKNT